MKFEDFQQCTKVEQEILMLLEAILRELKEINKLGEE